MRVSVDKAGVNREFKRLDSLLAEVSQQAYVASKSAGDKYADKVKSGIGLTTAPPFAEEAWIPLSAKWKSMKQSNKEKFWIETGGIFRNIHTSIIKKTLLFIHLFSGIRRQDDSEAFDRAVNNEYGSHLASPRPLFKPAANLFSIVTGNKTRKFKKNSEEYMLFKIALKNAIKKVYG